MDYDITALLFKLGLNELTVKQALRWQYVDAASPDISGFAEARLSDDGRRLEIELRHHFKNNDENDGVIGEARCESVILEARRVGAGPFFRIAKLAFDGTEYDPGNSAMVELAAGLFYARALKINDIMVEQRLQSARAQWHSAEEKLREKQATRRRIVAEAVKMADNMAGVIVPFRPRSDAPVQRI